MKKEETITDLLTSLARGDKQHVKININLSLNGPTASQYKLIRLFKKVNIKEQDFIKALFLTGVIEMSKKYLDKLLKVENLDIGTLLTLFKAFREDSLG